ncbi:zinc finger MYM-type protein 1-like [Zingiber officinale]|uniref:zinc finger MYM-type protein 1-like n=1 Tax=Zingiber officinale TaxID=94328 RepID=UPI001C4B86A9|nr:zinc finger MYM-type protein 1-like [Zingiber officinale]
MFPIRKQLSGAEKRKKKQKEEALIQSQVGSLNKYFTNSQKAEQTEVAEQLNQDDTDNKLNDQKHSELNELQNEDQKQYGNDKVEVNMPENNSDEDTNQEIVFPLNVDDPGNWDKMQNIRDFLVERGPRKDDDILFPLDNTGRHFNPSHYKRQLPNGEKSDKRWLVYSISMDKIFCFCCKLFKTQRTTMKLGHLADEGYKDWKNISRCLSLHETSKDHIDCMTSWIELERRLRKKKTIDENIQVAINKEREHWKQVLKRIIAVVQRIAKNNLPLRGDNEKLYVENNGIFLQLIEMIAEFNPIMEEHLRRVQERQIHYTYLGPKIQNELIQMLAAEVRSSIVAKIKHAKYFTVILDCTPNASHEEQMPLVIRCVDDSENAIVVEEFWIGFLKVNETSGLGLFTELKNILNNLELDIDNIRGQGYDNGSNMKGKHKGVQIKPLSQIRWESHVDSVKPIKDQTSKIRDALIDLANISDDSKIKSEAEGLTSFELENFEFVFGMVIWYKLLYEINIVSKFLQAENMDIDIAIRQLKGLISSLQEFRESGFDQALIEAEHIASEMGIEPIFREKRIIRRKRQFDEINSEEVTQSPKESFRVNYFLFIIDQALSSLQTRFEQFQKYEETFGFLFSLERLKYIDDDSLLHSCVNLQESLTHDGHSDVDGSDLYLELKLLRHSLPRESKRAIDVLNYLKKMDSCYPNAYIAYRILLTIPVTVASAERSFSKLKLIKTYLRSTMSQERLNGLAMLSIEKKVVEKVDYANLINTFASKTAR